MANFLQYPIFKDVILPFVLVFTLLFAILEKSKLLGEGKNQINAIISFVIAALFIAGFSAQVEWIKQFSAFLAVALMILFVFLLIYGFVYSGKDGFSLGEGYKTLIAGIAFVAVVGASLVITGYWEKVYSFFTVSNVGANVILGIIIITVIFSVLRSGSSTKREEKK